MKYNKIKLLVLLVISVFICACVPKQNKGSVDNIGTDKNIEMTKVTVNSFVPFYVYEDFKSSLNHYAPSGWMGDIANLKLDMAYEKLVYKGIYCIKIDYDSTGPRQWAGIYWQHPVNNWGDQNGGYNITGATKLTFWAKGEQGNETISEVKIGGISGAFSDSDVAWIKGLKLTREWKQYIIDLSKSDLTSISGGFCIVFSNKDNPRGCTVYLDEIKYE